MQTHTASDTRSRRRRMAPVIATGIAAILGSIYLRAVDPNVPGHYPGCPSQFLLGVDCPGCGGMRGTYDLLHGDVAGMVDDNILLVLPFRWRSSHLQCGRIARGLGASHLWTLRAKLGRPECGCGC
jgi:hypothetical protein